MAREYFEKKSKFDRVFVLALYAATITCVMYPHINEAMIYLVCFPLIVFALIVLMITNGDISTQLVAQSRYLRARRLIPMPTALCVLLMPSVVTAIVVSVKYFGTLDHNSDFQAEGARIIFHAATLLLHGSFMLFGMRWRLPMAEKPKRIRADEEIIEAACRFYGFTRAPQTR
ncbi:hypothetical protein IT570_05020 [Candidatus Sumerlaeota bacterium]|nr:hypothetical protein [Candidatus Sumerlaeota bacterium]